MSTETDTRKVHFLGTPFASSAACGRMIQTHREDEFGGPAHTDDRSRVTCKACQRAIGRPSPMVISL